MKLLAGVLNDPQEGFVKSEGRRMTGRGQEKRTLFQDAAAPRSAE